MGRTTPPIRNSGGAIEMLIAGRNQSVQRFLPRSFWNQGNTDE